MKWWLMTVAMVASAAVFGVILLMWGYVALDSSVSVRRTVHGIALVPDKHRTLDSATATPELLETRLRSLQEESEAGLSLLGFRYLSGPPATPAAANAALASANAPFGGMPARRPTVPPYWALVVPYWFLLLLFGVGPSWWLWTCRRQRYRRTHGLCLRCGYDLREAKEKCPECGQQIAAVGGRLESGME
jgi:hypothetical protein